MKTCVDCNTRVSDENAIVCPRCNGDHFVYEQKNTTNFSSSSNYPAGKQVMVNKQDDAISTPLHEKILEEIERLVSLQKIQIESQQKTTHAIRAFVRFLFIQLSTTTIAVILWQLSNWNVDEFRCLSTGENCSGNSLIQIMAAITWIIGVIWSSKVGWEELEKSEIKRLRL